MSAARWDRLGRVEDLKTKPLKQIGIGTLSIALSCRDVGNGDLHINLTPATKRVQARDSARPLTREIRREPEPLRVAGISTTAMSWTFPRYSTSEDLLQVALDHAAGRGAQSKLIRLNDLQFRACEGYGSISAGACTWPCTIITGGQDNIQAVVGQMLTFFGELGFLFPQFPFVAHSRGWSAEDMEMNMAHVKTDPKLRAGARALADRCLQTAAGLVAAGEGAAKIERGGRKACALE